MAQHVASAVDFHPLSNTSGHRDLLFDFHRLVMAQGIVSSYSSFSYAAILLGNATDVVVSSKSRVGEW